MTLDTCFADTDIDTQVKLTREEVEALFLNLIAFNGDWEAHLDFLNNLDASILWKYDQIPLVKELRKKDMDFGIQAAVA